MKLLALETATSVCGVALFIEDHVAVELMLDRPRAHSENLVSMIEDALGYARIEPGEIDAVAVSAGPGSYTGLRIGVSTAKGFAASVDAGLVAVPSLEALATGVHGAPSGDLIGAAFDARRDEAYVALFRATDEGLEQINETAAVRSKALAEWLRIGFDAAGLAGASDETTLWLVGEGWTKMTFALDETGMVYRHVQEIIPSAANVARIGAQRLRAGQTEDLVTFEPYYLKEFVATKPAQTPLEKLTF